MKGCGEKQRKGLEMVKEFSYHGMKQEDLKNMTLEEFIKVASARQRRTLRRGLTDTQKKLLLKLKTPRKKPVRTKSRDMIIIPEMIGTKLEVYTGKEFMPVLILTEMLGHYLGEFALTRKKVSHHAPGIGATRSSASLSVK